MIVDSLLSTASQDSVAPEEEHQSEAVPLLFVCAACTRPLWREMPGYGVHAAQRMRKYWGELQGNSPSDPQPGDQAFPGLRQKGCHSLLGENHSSLMFCRQKNLSDKGMVGWYKVTRQGDNKMQWVEI